MRRSLVRWTGAALLLVAFLASVLRFDLVESILEPVWRSKSIFIERSPLPELALQHIGMVGLSSLASLIVGLGLGTLASLNAGRGVRDLTVDLASIAETLPSAAIIALSVPLIGYGFAPTILALALYGILPIIRNTVIGLAEVDPDIVEAARGAGMAESTVLFRIKYPLALPVLLAGVRISVVINTSAATLGAAVGSGGLGVPIVSGLRSFDPVMILKGALPVTLLALALDAALSTIAHSDDSA